jgi:hypothetical protein
MTHTKEGIEKRKLTMLRKYGKLTWNKGLTKKIDLRLKKQSEDMKGIHYTPKTEFKKGHSDLVPKESRINQSKKMKGGNSGSFKKGDNSWDKNFSYIKIPKKLLEKLYFKERKSMTQIKNELGIDMGTLKRKFDNYKIKRRSNSKSIKIRYEDPQYKARVIKASLKGLLKRPTSYEQKICDLCLKYNLPFIYKGNGDFLINFKNPDFVNEEQKIVIEVFYSWFKIRDYGSVENYKDFCRKKYNPAGWRVIFIDEFDINSENWEDNCLQKIIKN